MRNAECKPKEHTMKENKKLLLLVRQQLKRFGVKVKILTLKECATCHIKEYYYKKDGALYSHRLR